jgi:membrane peptidoglycan carboxypeptidase
MATFEGAPRPRRPAWPSDPGPGEIGDGYHHEAGGFDDGFPPPPAPPKRRSFLWRWRRIFFIFGLLGMCVPAGGIAAMARTELPELDELLQSSFICAADVAENCNSQNAMAQISQDEDRVNVRLQDVPEVLRRAVIAAEDRSFYEHTGIDPVGIARALYRDVRAGGLSQGGSTITQQFVKNTYLTNERSLSRKLEEALLAIRVEQEMSKDEILEGYLNTIYFGRNAYGVQSASRAYFNKPVADLRLEEAAYLAGLIRAPELADAERDQEEAERRRRTVLDAMLEEGYITEDEHTFADAVPLEAPTIIPREEYRRNRMIWPEAEAKGMQNVTTYIREEARRILQEVQGIDAEAAQRQLDNGGLRIYTSIDKGLQVAAYDAVYTNTLNQPGDPAGALVALNNQGHIRAMVAGRAGTDDATDYNNYAIAGRPVGSTFKPIALAEAVARNFSLEGSRIQAPGTTTIDPRDLPCDPWEVSNYDEEDAPGGTFNLIEATQYSSNTAYGELMAQLGPANVERMAQDLGMDSELSDCLPVVLGSDNSTPLEMAEVYSTFANQGMHREPTIITRIEQVDRDGEVSEIYEWQFDERQVLTADQANLVTYALRQVVENGTGQAANIGKPVAGKTGTTSSNRDAWFVGYTPGLTASVWMGHPDATWINPECMAELDATQGPTADPAVVQQRQTECTEIPPMNTGGIPVHDLQSVTGGSLPAEIFKRFMEVATQSSNDTFVDPPPELLRQGQELGEGGDYNSGTEPIEPEVTQPTMPGGSGPSSSSTLPPDTGPDTTDMPRPKRRLRGDLPGQMTA